jgi:hypothetical protein
MRMLPALHSFSDEELDAHRDAAIEAMRERIKNKPWHDINAVIGSVTSAADFMKKARQGFWSPESVRARDAVPYLAFCMQRATAYTHSPERLIGLSLFARNLGILDDVQQALENPPGEYEMFAHRLSRSPVMAR